MTTIKITTADLKADNLDTLYKKLKTSARGLKTAEAAKRIKIFGYNQIKKSEKMGVVWNFLSHFKDPLILVLIGAALISGIAGQHRNAAIILAMIFLSVILDFYQENKSNRAAEKIASRLAIKATVLRDGREQELSTKLIVPGDVISLSAGDIVPADGKLISADDFFLNEASLTGESLPLEKAVDSNSYVFSGTNVVSGFGHFVVTSTGPATEFGQIAQKLARPENQNAFEIGIKNFGLLIVRVIGAIVMVIFLINAIIGKGFFNSFLFALAVAVGVTPELLPMILSVNMARGATKMSKKGVLVKKLNAIPTFGSIDILCTDKTGTLTQDKITLVKNVDAFGKDSENVFLSAYLNGFFETGIKSILDKAILQYKKIDLKEYHKVEEIPYDFNRKRSSVITEHEKSLTMTTKGAPEEIFKACSHYQDKTETKVLTSKILLQIRQTYNDFSSQGFRILAIAAKPIKKHQEKYTATEETDMTFLGFMVFYDPPKTDVKETLVMMKDYGIAIKILTGDGPLITKKICADLGLEVKGIVTGEELDLNTMTDEEIFHRITGATICARMSPSQKEKIILELKKHGATVGYLGDGINDAPSLKAADVGISVENAVDVARETADIIMLRKGLKELMDGVIEGRRTFGNTIKYLLMCLSSNFGNMFSMIGASIFLPFFPMTASQILLNNFLYDTSQLSIPSDNVDITYLKRPKHWDISFIKRYMVVFGLISSAFDFLTFYVLFGIFHLSGSVFQSGWFIESLATQILVVYIIRTQKIPFIQSKPSKYLVYTTLGILILGNIMILDGIGSWFGFGLLPLYALTAITGLVIAYLIIVELTKHWFYKKWVIQ